MYNLLRKTGTGERIYYGLTQTAEDILSTFLKRSAGKEQPATYEDRIQKLPLILSHMLFM